MHKDNGQPLQPHMQKATGRTVTRARPRVAITITWKIRKTGRQENSLLLRTGAHPTSLKLPGHRITGLLLSRKDTFQIRKRWIWMEPKI